MSCGIGHRRGSDPELLWLWRRLMATAPIRPLAWEPPYAAGAAQEIAKRQKNKNKINNQFNFPKDSNILLVFMLQIWKAIKISEKLFFLWSDIFNSMFASKPWGVLMKKKNPFKYLLSLNGDCIWWNRHTTNKCLPTQMTFALALCLRK